MHYSRSRVLGAEGLISGVVISLTHVAGACLLCSGKHKVSVTQLIRFTVLQLRLQVFRISHHHLVRGCPCCCRRRKEDCTNTSDVQSLEAISQDGRLIRRTAIYYVTTAEQAGDAQAALQRRNAHFRVSAPRFQGRILPMDKMAATGNFRNTDGLHYGAGQLQLEGPIWGPSVPRWLSQQTVLP